MKRRGGWKTVLRYAAGILALAVSVAAAWFLPGLYAGWQDARTEGRVVLSKRDNIQFLDTASLDLAGRLKMFEEAENFSWEWSLNSDYGGLKSATEETIDRFRGVMGDWCEAGLFPEDCLAVITAENLMFSDTALVYLESAVLQVYGFHFREADGYAVTLLTDTDMDVIYYASVSGPSMLDVIAEDRGFASFEAMAQYNLRLLENQGIAPDDMEKLRESGAYEDLEDIYSYVIDMHEQEIRPAEESRYDFAAVCGAQGMEAERRYGNLEMDVRLTFESFTGHAYRTVVGVSYFADIWESVGVGFAVMYGTDKWRDLVADFASTYGGNEVIMVNGMDGIMEWYDMEIAYAVRDPEILGQLRYPPDVQETDEARDAAQKSPGSEAYDGELSGSEVYSVEASGNEIFS